MKNGLISFAFALFCTPQLFAMDIHDSTAPQSKAQARLYAVEQRMAAQRLLAQKAQARAQRAQKEKEQAPERVSTLTRAFAQLPSARNTTQDFGAVIASRMPSEVQKYIGEFHGNKGNTDFIDQHLMELIPCVTKKHRFYPSTRKLMDLAINRLNDYAKVHAERQQALVENQDQGQPYIIAVAGFWSFNDESSKFRYRAGVRNQATDLKQWFSLHYPNNQVKALASDEWLAVLYSDGSIAWRVSPLSKARLKQLSKEQLLLLVDLWRSELLQQKHVQAYGLLPVQIKQAISSNYSVAPSRFMQYIKTGLQWTAVAGGILGVMYGLVRMRGLLRYSEHWIIPRGKNVKFCDVKTISKQYGSVSEKMCAIYIAAFACLLPANYYDYEVEQARRPGQDVFNVPYDNKIPLLYSFAAFLGMLSMVINNGEVTMSYDKI